MVFKTNFNIFAFATFATGLAMLLPAGLGFVQGEYETARTFLYQGVLVIILALFLNLALFQTVKRVSVRQDILEFSLIFLLMPAIMAFPFYVVIEGFSILDAYFEAFSCFTTTGFSLIPASDYESWAIDFWRGFISWMGGLMIWVIASTLIRHFGLGLLSHLSRAGKESQLSIRIDSSSDDEISLWNRVYPIIILYFILSSIIWGYLYLTEGNLFPSIMIAMATISTSGIGLSSGMEPISVWGEIGVAILLVFALSRLFLMIGELQFSFKGFLQNPEIRLAGLILLFFLVLSLLKDWQLLNTKYNNQGITETILFAWGKLFTFLSFLTTTGFESSFWIEGTTEDTSGYTVLILFILVFIGGGIGTNAGGLKLWRFNIFLQKIQDEVYHMLLPSVVTNSEAQAQVKSGWEDAWLVFVFFISSLLILTIIFSLEGFGLKEGVTISLAALTTTGPLIHSVLDGVNQNLYQLGNLSKIALLIGMILGRLEVVLLFFVLSNGLVKKLGI